MTVQHASDDPAAANAAEREFDNTTKARLAYCLRRVRAMQAARRADGLCILDTANEATSPADDQSDIT